jgi:CRISPR-associated protein Csb1
MLSAALKKNPCLYKFRAHRNIPGASAPGLIALFHPTISKEKSAMPTELTLDALKQAVAGHAAAFRCVTDYQPAGGEGDKIFPPTYEGGKYATETRHLDGREVNCVLVDSVQSQANRMELALLEARRAGRIGLPLITVRFDQEGLLKKFDVSSLEAPHRIADAILRDSLLDGVIFRKSAQGRVLDHADARNATGLFGLCPTALVFGLWDSTGPRGGLGAKFQRALVSEMVGLDAIPGTKTSSRIDPLQIQLGAGPLFERAEKSDSAPAWTPEESAAATNDKDQPIKLGKDGKPSEANHGNVTPDFAFAKDKNGNITHDNVPDKFGALGQLISRLIAHDGGRDGVEKFAGERKIPRVIGGYTVSKVRQTTVLSLAALRRLRFPLDGAPDSDPKADQAARVVLAALGLAAATLSREEGADLRSRCQLFPTEAFVWHLLDTPGTAPKDYTLDGAATVALLNAAVAEARALGLPWEGDITLTPHPDLVRLVRRSQESAAHEATGDA